MSYKGLFFPILRRRSSYPTRTKYSRYRQEIREDCQGRCVYCDVHENEIGGADDMTIDHFRPKTFPQFRSLQHDPENLMWSCNTCNQNKRSLWPAIGTPYTFVGRKGFIDPFKEDRRSYFDIASNGTLVPLRDPAQWLIRQLLLNRIGARSIREKRIRNYLISERYITECESWERLLNETVSSPGSTDAEMKLVEICRKSIQEAKAIIDSLKFDTALK